MFESQLTAMKKEVEKPIHNQLRVLQEAVAELDVRVKEIEQKVEENRREFPQLIEQKSSELKEKLDEQFSKFSSFVERCELPQHFFHNFVFVSSRKVAEKKLEKIIQEQQHTFQEKLQVDHIARDAKFASFRNEVSVLPF
jgi:signal transduction protein with GAF and PtsI domain